MDATVIHNPARFVPGTALAFGAEGQTPVMVDASHPLPVEAVLVPATSIPLVGAAATTGRAGPFVPVLGRPVQVTLTGSWNGAVQLLRSTDGGATRLPLTFIDGSTKAVWTGNVNAAAHEETVAGAALYLAITLTAGTVGYRVEQ